MSNFLASLTVFAINYTPTKTKSTRLDKFKRHVTYSTNLTILTGAVFDRSFSFLFSQVNENGSFTMKIQEIESEMQQLVKMMLENPSDDIHSSIKQTFFVVARSFYYSAYYDPGTINNHLTRVFFERVI